MCRDMHLSIFIFLDTTFCGTNARHCVKQNNNRNLAKATHKA